MNRRYSAVLTKEQLSSAYGSLNMPKNLRSNYNIKPRDRAYVITNTHPGHLQYFVWGLLPSWSHDGINKGNLTEARLETITSQTSFRIPIRRKRCLIPADSYYMWLNKGHRRVPYRVHRKDRQLMWIAGVWDKWTDAFDAQLSFAMISREFPKSTKAYSTKTPVIFSEAAKGREWMKIKDVHQAVQFLQTMKIPSLVRHRVSEKLNNPGINSPELHVEVVDTPTLFE